MDPTLDNSKKKIKLLLMPGVIVTWPYFVYKSLNKHKRIKNNSYKLRQLHLLFWVVIICSLPGLLLIARDGFAHTDKNLTTTQKKPNIEKDKYTAENEFMGIHLESKHIRIDLIKPLKSASSLVFSCDPEGNRLKLLGQIQNQNIYEFETDENIAGILIYDDIKNKTITKLIFP